MWDKFLQASGRALRPAKAMAATVVTDCEELPLEDCVEVRQFFCLIISCGCVHRSRQCLC